MLRRTIISLLVTLAVPTTALANEWNVQHPRRTEVNHRLERQNARIREGVATGRLSRGEARRLHAEDRSVRAEERAMAAANGGHITRREQRVLNREENANSRRIFRQKH
jgi:hypothetical protein